MITLKQSPWRLLIEDLEARSAGGESQRWVDMNDVFIPSEVTFFSDVHNLVFKKRKKKKKEDSKLHGFTGSLVASALHFKQLVKDFIDIISWWNLKAPI